MAILAQTCDDGFSDYPGKTREVDEARAALIERLTAQPNGELIERIIAAVMANVSIGNRVADDAPATRLNVSAAKAAVLAAMSEGVDRYE